jgi:hypothetical protein
VLVLDWIVAPPLDATYHLNIGPTVVVVEVTVEVNNPYPQRELSFAVGAEGIGFTTTVVDDVFVQVVAGSTAVTVYVVVDVGETLNTFPVPTTPVPSFQDQLYVPAVNDAT